MTRTSPDQLRHKSTWAEAVARPQTTLAGREDVEDFVHGLGFYGTGGGGPIVDGLELLLGKIEGGRTIGWSNADDLPRDAWTVTVSRVGGPARADGTPSVRDLAAHGFHEPDVHGNEGGMARVHRQVAAARALAEWAQVSIAAVIPLELGGGNTAGAIVTAARLGVPTIDGDYTGRAIPDLTGTKVALLNRAAAPAAVVDRWNNTTVITHALGSATVDRLARMLAFASFGRVGMASFLLAGHDAVTAMVPGKAGPLVAAWRAARGRRPCRGRARLMEARALTEWRTAREVPEKGPLRVGRP